jgi:hypothetical protein
VIGNLDALSKNIGLVGVFDLGDKLICHPDLAARFTSFATKQPAKVIMNTTTGLITRPVVIVSLPDVRGESLWAYRASKIFSILANDEGWLFTQEDASTNTAKGIISNLLKSKIRATRTQVIIIPEGGEPMQGYYLVKRS